MKHLLFCLIIGLMVACGETTSTKTANNIPAPKFILTHMLGQKLPKEATLYVTGETWILDYNNGDKVTYKIISGREDTPLCHIKAIDNTKEKCEICITKTGDNALVQFKYGEKILSFDGHYSEF